MGQLVDTSQGKSLSEQVRERISSIPHRKRHVSNPREHYRDYLIWSHSITRASIPLMECSYYTSLHIPSVIKEFYRSQIEEEKGHDENIISDLESIGITRQEVLSYKPSQQVAEVVGSQYYWIFHFDPVILLGYIAAVDSPPTTIETINELQRLTGYPSIAFRTLRQHAGLDIKHSQTLNYVLDKAVLSDEQKKWIMENAYYTKDRLCLKC